MTDHESAARRVDVVAGPKELAREAADTIVRAAQQAIAARGRFTIAVSGGDTARAIYEQLAAPARLREVDWSRAEVYWGDERCVGPAHPRSNYGMAKEVLLSRLSIPDEQVHRMRGEDDPAAGAAAYERLLRERFGLAHGPPTAPLFDINHMGMGEDGHTASLFPGVDAIDEHERWALPTWQESTGEWRITLTPPALNASRLVLVTVSGAAKAERLREVFTKERPPRELPVRVLQPKVGTLAWLVDEAAASRLPRSSDAPSARG